MEAEINVKSDNTIQLEENKDVLRLKILDPQGNETGECLEFYIADLDYLLILQDMLEKDKKIREDYKRQLLIIDKKQDHAGKKLFSANEEAKIKLTRDFCNAESEIYNMFLGENGVQKLLNGRKLTPLALKQIDKYIEQQITPQLQLSADYVKSAIMEKYSKPTKRDDVIE